MKIHIEIDPQLNEPEIVIRCSELNESIVKLQSDITANAGTAPSTSITYYKDDTEYYLSFEDILFFETAENEVWAHTKDDEYLVHHKLYELEQVLPRCFLRISKSAILNTKKVYSIARNLTASSKIEFLGTPKTVYVSRNYYKLLKDSITVNKR